MIQDMEFGAYFIEERDWDSARSAGIDWCAWPPIIPDTKGTGEGFVTKKVIVDLRTGKETPYPRDEVARPDLLKEPPGSFITIAQRERGLNAKDLSPKYQRAIVNYFLGWQATSAVHTPWQTIVAGGITAHRCAEAWKGTPWTVVINTNSDLTGLLDGKSEKETVPTELLWDQVNWYRELGAWRIFWWRWDTDCGIAGIDAIMEKVRRWKKSGDWKRRVRGRSPFLKMPL